MVAGEYSFHPPADGLQRTCPRSPSGRLSMGYRSIDGLAPALVLLAAVHGGGTELLRRAADLAASSVFVWRQVPLRDIRIYELVSIYRYI